MSWFSNTLRSYISQNQTKPLVKKLSRWCHSMYQTYENLNYDHNTNGERFVLEKLSTQPFENIFDVGANVGNWSSMASDIFPESNIFAFEVVDNVRETLRKNLTPYKRVRIMDEGLSDENGTLKINFYPEEPGYNSMYDCKHPDNFVVRNCPVRKGDDVLKDLKLESINFLKIDVEGAENKILEGFRESLKSGNVHAIQFEYTHLNIISKFLLRDFYEMLEPLGFKIGKIYPHFVRFHSYEHTEENFIGPNYWPSTNPSRS